MRYLVHVRFDFAPFTQEYSDDEDIDSENEDTLWK